jgi:hypothetical protein
MAVSCPTLSVLVLQVATNKRYAGAGQFTVSEVAQRVKADIGNIDIVVSGRCRVWMPGAMNIMYTSACS